jgi:hypothetical protein
MTDLVAGRYPVAEEDWVLDGTPFPPYRRTINRRDITGGYALTTTQLNVYAVPVQDGDIFNYVSFLVSVAGGTLTHSWVALYNGVATGAALLAQSTDNTTATGWAIGSQKIQLASTVNADVAQPGTPQGPAGGPGQWAVTPVAGPTVVGVAVYQAGTTGDTFDGMAGGAVAGGAVTGQVAMFSTGTLAATATAPSVLPTMTAAVPSGHGGIPYLLLSRQ